MIKHELYHQIMVFSSVCYAVLFIFYVSAFNVVFASTLTLHQCHFVSMYCFNVCNPNFIHDVQILFTIAKFGNYFVRTMSKVCVFVS